MTLQTAAKMLADREKGRIFPRIVLYVRLGEFHVDGRVTSDDVVDYVKKLAPPAIRDRFETLAGDGRLIIYFDGMDEMSRDRYGDHTQALSTFAERSGAKTLFSCRITDFSPRFLHKRLVLLPFNRQQITEYLSRYIAAFPLTISGKAWTLRKLASHIDSGELPIETNNPFVLWLLSFFLQEKQSWPASRVELLDYYNTSNYQRKQSEIEPHEHPLLDQKTAFQEWSRMAYVITNRNRGPAIPVQALLENSNIEVTLEAIRTGKRCGVITESFEGHEYLIRFQHHRFQEYFTAAYIHDFAPSINWDDKLDAPRWQETIVNLVQMDRGQDVVGVLIASLHRMVNKSDKELQNLDPELQHLPPRFENRLADRVELTSRILRQTGSSDIRESLLEPFTRAINNLSLYGNPLSQVKVMRACQNVPEISLVDVMKQALKSPVNWVRKQAIMVLANSRGAMGTDLATEAGFDLASGQYVTRLPTYIAATLKGNSAGSWLFLCAFVACCALQMLVTLALPCAAYLYLAQDSSHRFGIPTHWLREPLSIGFTAFVTLVMAVLTVQKKPGMLWLTTPAVCLITATSIMASIDLWNVSFNLLRYFGLVLSLPVMLAIIVIGAFVPQATTLGLYLLLSVHFRKTGKLTKALFLTLWREGKFEWMLYLVGGPAVLIVISTLSWLSHYFGIAMLNESEFLGFPPIALVGMAIFYAIYLLFFYIMGAEPRSVFNLLLFYATTSLVFIVLFWGIRTLIEQEFYLYVQRAIFVVFTLAVSAIVLMGMRFAYRYLLERLRWSLSKYPAGKFTPDKWKQEIVKASAPKQVGILLRTSHQAVSLGPEEFLKLFIEIEKTITKEPALSTYWQMREQLDQALRQEREG